MRSPFLAALLLVLLAPVALAQKPALVKDINLNAPTPKNSEPGQFVQLAPNKVLFVAETLEHGEELWVTDMTATGTRLVKDIVPGMQGSMPKELTVAGSVAYFTVVEAGDLQRLWRTDGTARGTFRLKDLYYQPLKNNRVNAYAAAWGSTLYFAATDSQFGTELWKTDGTVNGTQLVKDIMPGSNGSNPNGMTPVGKTLYFIADDATTGSELWKTDGTYLGTVLVKDIRPGPEDSNIQNIYVPGGGRFAWFTADDGVHGQELWRTDGTAAGTVLVHDIYPGLLSSSPSDFVVSRGQVLFAATDGVVVGGHTRGRELWSLDAGAVAWPVGHPCGQGYPILGGKDPVLDGRGAVPNKTAIFFGTFGQAKALRLGATGCATYLDLGTPLLVLGAKGVSGAGTFQLSFSITNDPTAIGVQGTSQSLISPTTGALGFDMSNGVSLVMGR